MKQSLALKAACAGEVRSSGRARPLTYETGDRMQIRSEDVKFLHRAAAANAESDSRRQNERLDLMRRAVSVRVAVRGLDDAERYLCDHWRRFELLHKGQRCFDDGCVSHVELGAT